MLFVVQSLVLVSMSLVGFGVCCRRRWFWKHSVDVVFVLVVAVVDGVFLLRWWLFLAAATVIRRCRRVASLPSSKHYPPLSDS